MIDSGLTTDALALPNKRCVSIGLECIAIDSTYSTVYGQFDCRRGEEHGGGEHGDGDGLAEAARCAAPQSNSVTLNLKITRETD